MLKKCPKRLFVGKEARKQELKKNKKQRQMVRAAVLKGKDPQQILEEMEKIDQMGRIFLLFLCSCVNSCLPICPKSSTSINHLL